MIPRSATVKDKSCFTYGQPCVAEEWIKTKDGWKYRVDFDNGWQGYYFRKQLSFDKGYLEGKER